MLPAYFSGTNQGWRHSFASRYHPLFDMIQNFEFAFRCLEKNKSSLNAVYLDRKETSPSDLMQIQVSSVYFVTWFQAINKSKKS